MSLNLYRIYVINKRRHVSFLQYTQLQYHFCEKTFQRVRSQPDFIEAARPKRKAEGFTESESDDSDDEPEPEAGMASAPGVLQGEAKAEPSPTKGEATSPTKVEKKEEDEAAKRWAKRSFFLFHPISPLEVELFEIQL